MTEIGFSENVESQAKLAGINYNPKELSAGLYLACKNTDENHQDYSEDEYLFSVDGALGITDGTIVDTKHPDMPNP